MILFFLVFVWQLGLYFNQHQTVGKVELLMLSGEPKSATSFLASIIYQVSSSVCSFYSNCEIEIPGYFRYMTVLHWDTLRYAEKNFINTNFVDSSTLYFDGYVPKDGRTFVMSLGGRRGGIYPKHVIQGFVPSPALLSYASFPEERSSYQNPCLLHVSYLTSVWYTGKTAYTFRNFNFSRGILELCSHMKIFHSACQLKIGSYAAPPLPIRYVLILRDPRPGALSLMRMQNVSYSDELFSASVIEFAVGITIRYTWHRSFMNNTTFSCFYEDLITNPVDVTNLLAGFLFGGLDLNLLNTSNVVTLADQEPLLAIRKSPGPQRRYASSGAWATVSKKLVDILPPSLLSKWDRYYSGAGRKHQYIVEH